MTTPITSAMAHCTLVICRWGGLACAMLCFRIGFGKKLRARLDLLTPWCQPTGWMDESPGVFIRFSGSQVSQGLHCSCLQKGACVLQFFLLSLSIACEKPATVFVYFNSSWKNENQDWVMPSQVRTMLTLLTAWDGLLLRGLRMITTSSGWRARDLRAWRLIPRFSGCHPCGSSIESLDTCHSRRAAVCWWWIGGLLGSCLFYSSKIRQTGIFLSSFWSITLTYCNRVVVITTRR
jgi:hypothetical protein